MNTQLSFEELEKLWNEFEDVPIDKDECIDEDFLHELLHHVDGIEVLEPANVRDRTTEMLENTLKRYKRGV